MNGLDKRGWVCPACNKFTHWGYAHRCPNTPFVLIKPDPVERPREEPKVPEPA